jgi:hypothetical protein
MALHTPPLAPPLGERYVRARIPSAGAPSTAAIAASSSSEGKQGVNARSELERLRARALIALEKLSQLMQDAMSCNSLELVAP